ncbi:MAG: hypothetical protein EBU84_12735, partial [Actinobacteria bacterium]|nr:hypothetical protein [Actinomycetota bacterium]
MKISITSALGFTPDQFSLIIRAHELANKVLKTEALEKIVRDTYDPRLISALLGQEPIRLTLRFYRPWNPFTSALAYTQSGIIYLNPNSLNRGTAELAGTLM